MLEKIKETCKKWWLALILGIISVILGVVLITVPGEGFEIAAIFVQINFIVAGIVSIVSTIARRKEIPAWGFDLVLAILVLLLGFSPMFGETFLIIGFTIGFVAVGFSTLFSSIILKKSGAKGWGWSLAFAIITIILGFDLIFKPLLSVFTIGLLVGIEFFSFGISMIALGVEMAKTRGMVKRIEEENNI